MSRPMTGTAETIQDRRGTAGWIASSRSLVAMTVSGSPSPPIEDKTGDDEHRRHRQRLRERFRGGPFGGFLHAVLPRHDSSLRESASDGQTFYSEHPTTSSPDLSPHSANIDLARVDQQYGAILARAQPICARVMEF
jgi:hypothetical protein